jgi:very-short-patch-repair endonuclease
MSQPEIKEKACGPEARAKSQASLLKFWQADTPQTQAMRKAIAGRNAMHIPEVRAKVSATMKQRGHRPTVRGGNGTGLTLTQKELLAALGDSFCAEFSVATQSPKVKGGLPTHYCIDIAEPVQKLAIEIDGRSHRSPKQRAADKRKTDCLQQLGWTVLRFSNQEILDSMSTVVAKIRSLYMTSK